MSSRNPAYSIPPVETLVKRTKEQTKRRTEKQSSSMSACRLPQRPLAPPPATTYAHTHRPPTGEYPQAGSQRNKRRLKPGGHSPMVPPGPIPNPEVKHWHVDDSRARGPAKVDSCQDPRSPSEETQMGCSFFTLERRESIRGSSPPNPSNLQTAKYIDVYRIIKIKRLCPTKWVKFENFERMW